MPLGTDASGSAAVAAEGPGSEGPSGATESVPPGAAPFVRNGPLVTVVLVSAGWPVTIDAAIDSVRLQTYPAWELIVVDDRWAVGPPPAADADGRVRVLSTGGCGPAAAHNRALEVTKGGLVAYVDDDAEMAPEWLATLAAAYVAWPATPVFFGAWRDGAESARGPTPPLGAVAHRPELAAARFDVGPDDGSPTLALLGLPGARRLPSVACLARRPSRPAASDPAASDPAAGDPPHAGPLTTEPLAAGPQNGGPQNGGPQNGGPQNGGPPTTGAGGQAAAVPRSRRATASRPTTPSTTSPATVR